MRVTLKYLRHVQRLLVRLQRVVQSEQEIPLLDVVEPEEPEGGDLASSFAQGKHGH